MNTPGMAWRPAQRRLTAAAAAAIALHALAAYSLFKTFRNNPEALSAQRLTVRLVDTPSPAVQAQTNQVASPARRSVRAEKPTGQTTETPPSLLPDKKSPLQTNAFSANAAATEPGERPDIDRASVEQDNEDSDYKTRETAASSASILPNAKEAEATAAPEVICPGYQTALAAHAPPRQLLRSGQGGEVIVEFTVAQDGSVNDVVAASSTNPRLNHWATNGVRRKLHCTPQARAVKLRLPMRLRFD